MKLGDITLTGKVLPYTFLCLQKSTCSFVNLLSGKFQNVIVSCLKLGKFTTELQGIYIEYIIKPYVGEIFLL